MTPHQNNVLTQVMKWFKSAGFVILLVTVALMGLVTLALFASQTERNSAATQPPAGFIIYKRTFEGHDYLQSSTGSPVHSESCPCKQRERP